MLLSAFLLQPQPEPLGLVAPAGECLGQFGCHLVGVGQQWRAVAQWIVEGTHARKLKRRGLLVHRAGVYPTGQVVERAGVGSELAHDGQSGQRRQRAQRAHAQQAQPALHLQVGGEGRERQRGEEGPFLTGRHDASAARPGGAGGLLGYELAASNPNPHIQPGGLPCHREYHREYSWRGSTARVLSWQAWR